MANEQNLTMKCQPLSREQAAKGGVNSGKTRQLQSALRKAMAKSVPGDLTEVNALLDNLGVPKTGRTYADAVAYAQVNKAAKGDTQAAVWVRDTCGEKPTDKVVTDLGERTASIVHNISLSKKKEMLDSLLKEFSEKE